MISEDRFGFRPIWDELLAIYAAVAKICERHGLRYYVVEGNAIGALRHRGFVPWDDDMDIAMPRPDYEEFIKVANQELPPHLRYWNWRDIDQFVFTFGKVQDVREAKVREVETKIGAKLSSGIYIDILVIDGCPDGGLSLLWYKLKMLVLGSIDRCIQGGYSGQTFKGKFSWLLGFVLKMLLPSLRTHKAVFEAVERQMKSVPFETAKLTWRAGAAVRVTMTFPRRVWDGRVDFEFDSIEVPLPAGYDFYLRTQYGDYMKLPPREKQRPSHSLPDYFPWWLGPK